MTKTSVLKDTLTLSVSNGHEHGTFFLRQGTTTNGATDSLQHWCLLSVYSSFGPFGHYWGNMGCPAAEFLSQLNKGYLLDKLFGDERSVFDAVLAIENTKRAVLRARQMDNLSKEEARDAYDCIYPVYHEAEFIVLIMQNEHLHNLALNQEIDTKGPNQIGENFWNRLWPGFITALNAVASQS